MFSLALMYLPAAISQSPPDWKSWLSGFGHDTFQYPQWVKDEMNNCTCIFSGTHVLPIASCHTGALMVPKQMVPVDWRLADVMDYCTAKAWLLAHMPPFDQQYLPPSVSVDGRSMFDDNIAFALMVM